MSNPGCFGNYTDRFCLFTDCPDKTRWECLEAARLQELKKANRLRRRGLGEVPRHLRPLLKKGYPAGVLWEG